jgi:hypothetical protein
MMILWSEAVGYLKQGLAIRRARWPSMTRIKLVDGRLRIFRSGIETDHGYFYPEKQHKDATDWMVYE